MKNLKTFKEKVNENKIGDWLHDKSTILTGKLEIWEMTERESRIYTNKVVDILIERGYKLTYEAGIMTDGSPIWALTDDGMQPIVISPKTNSYKNRYDRSISISVSYYFVTRRANVSDIIAIDVNDLEKTADEVSNSLEKFRKNNYKGNIFSRQGSIKLF